MRLRTTHAILSLLSVALVCCAGPCGKVQAAEDILLEAIRKLEETSLGWQIVLEDTIEELEDFAHQTIAADVQNLLSRTISDVGIEARCYTDFLRDRVKEDLKRMVGAITGEEVVLQPVFCNPVPAVVDMNLSPERRTHIEISGYNLDDVNVQAFLIDASGTSLNVSQHLADPTRYLLTLNLGGNGVPLTSTSAKIEFDLPGNESRSVSVIQPAPPQPVRLRVTIVYIDVYLDGSPGKDTWSTNFSVNGSSAVIWNKKKDISDNCSEAYGRGPGGDKNACRYVISGSWQEVVLQHDQTLTVKFWGTAHDDGDEVSLSTRNFTPSENWGVGRGPYRGEGKDLHRMGERYRGDTSYFTYFCVQRVG